ncbi:MAG TPA: type II CAAX endopeptidase family protein [Propionibacteriaceae bacterium]|nr:type II CAAX endopeptidase family protein [Propionibacteriaceae bacterium]
MTRGELLRPAPWRGALTAPGPRPTDGLDADSPTGWPHPVWFRNAWFRLATFVTIWLVIATAASPFTSGDTPGDAWRLALLELVTSVVAYLIVVVGLENRRPPFELRVDRWRGLLVGLALGAGVCLLVVGILVLLGARRFTGVDADFAWAYPVFRVAVVAGVSEEIIFRGILYRLVESHWGTWAALAVSSAAFGAAHLTNENATAWGVIAIAVEAGLMFGILYTLTRSLWLVIGIHAAWNLTQGAVLGSVVSGTSGLGNGWFLSEPTGPDWLSGGAFGIEASPVAVALWLVVALWAAIRVVREGRVIAPFWVRHRRATEVATQVGLPRRLR